MVDSAKPRRQNPPMRRHQKLIVAVCVVGLAGLCTVALRTSEPSYQGRSLKEWLPRIPQSTTGPGRS